MQRLNHPGPKQVHRLERQAQQGVFGLALDPRPHRLARLGAVGAGAGHIDKGHLRIEPRQGAGGDQGEVIGEVGVLGFIHARRRHAEAEEACIKALQQVFQRLEVQHVAVQHLVQLAVFLGQRRAAHGDHFLHVSGQQALAQHALADHAGGAE